MTKATDNLNASTAKRAAKGPKPGSARANQSVKMAGAKVPTKPSYAEGMAKLKKIATKLDKVAKGAPAPKDTGKNAKRPDVITEVKAATSGDKIAVSAGAGTVYVDRARMVGELNKLAAVGASLKAVQDYLATHKPEAKLARGLTGRDAPQSAAAAAQSRGKPAPASAAPVKAGTSKSAPKAAKAAGAPRGGDRVYSATKKPVEAREGTWRHYMLTMIRSAVSTSAANAAHAKSKQFSGNKLDFNWSAREGYIVFKA